MIKFVEYDDMPDDNEEISKIEITFPSLTKTQHKRNMNFIEDLIEYLHREGESVNANELRFIKAVQVKEQKFWIWEFLDEEGERCYATVSENPEGVLCFSYDFDLFNLTPDQFILGEYHNVF